MYNYDYTNKRFTDTDMDFNPCQKSITAEELNNSMNQIRNSSDNRIVINTPLVPLKEEKVNVVIKEPEDEGGYNTIKYMLINDAMTVKCAADMIAAQIAHNTIHLAYEDDAVEFMRDNWDELNKHLFDNIKDLISIHLNTFVRYERLKERNRHYFGIKPVIKKMIEFSNEYYGYKFKFEDFDKEIDMVYETFR